MPKVTRTISAHRWEKQGPPAPYGRSKCKKCGQVKVTLYALGAGSSPVVFYQVDDYVWDSRRTPCGV